MVRGVGIWRGRLRVCTDAVATPHGPAALLLPGAEEAAEKHHLTQVIGIVIGRN